MTNDHCRLCHWADMRDRDDMSSTAQACEHARCPQCVAEAGMPVPMEIRGCSCACHSDNPSIVVSHVVACCPLIASLMVGLAQVGADR